MEMTITTDNHIFSGPESSNSSNEDTSSGTAAPPVTSSNVSTLPDPPPRSSSASSLSFLLNADNVELDNQLSIRNRPFSSYDSRDTQLS